MRIILTLILSLIVTSVFADENIPTYTGNIYVQDNFAMYGNNKYPFYEAVTVKEGTVIRDLHNVVFRRWNFRSDTPHTDMFIDCSNLTFIDSSIVNVNLPPNSKIIRTLTIHKRIYEKDGKKYKEVECRDNKTRTYEIVEEAVDEIESDFGSLEKADKDKLKLKYAELGKQSQYTTKREVLTDVKETPIDSRMSATFSN